MMLVALLFIACSKPAEYAALSLDEATRALFVSFHTDEAEALALELSTRVDEERDGLAEGRHLALLDASDVDGLAFDEVADLAVTYGAAFGRAVSGSMASHAAVVPNADQSWSAPSYDRYDRVIVSGTAAAFEAGGELQTDNTIEKDVGLVVLPYPMDKDYRWFNLPGGQAMLMRSIIYDAGFSADGKTGVVVGFTIEARFPEGADGIYWYNATWTQVMSPFELTEDFLVAQILDGIEEEFDATEAYVTGE